MKLTSDTMAIRVAAQPPTLGNDPETEEKLRQWVTQNKAEILKRVERMNAKGKPYKSWDDFVFRVSNSNSPLSEGVQLVTSVDLENRVLNEVLGPIPPARRDVVRDFLRDWR